MILSKTKRATLVTFTALLLAGVWLLQTKSIKQDKDVPELSELPNIGQPNLTIESQSTVVKKLSHIQVTKEKDNESEIINKESDQVLIAEIDADMQLTLPPEGDLSYMSPENETVQPVDPIFPAVEPSDPNATLGEEASGPLNIGTPFEEKDR